jgi:hypothetical protein
VATRWEYCELAELRLRCPSGDRTVRTLALPDAIVSLAPEELIRAAGRLAEDGWAPVDVHVELGGPGVADWTFRSVLFRRPVDNS